jgi:hypothetical protein
VDLDKNLRRNSPRDDNGAWVKTLPLLPGKNLFALSRSEMETRRVGLERYTRGLCTTAVLGVVPARALVENFLLFSDDDPEATMDIKVLRESRGSSFSDSPPRQPSPVRGRGNT